MLITFNGQTAIVTGGAGGIGYTIVKTLLESDAKVAILDVNQAAMDKAVAELSAYGTVKGYQVNLAEVETIAPAVEQVRKELGEVTLLVNCAGLMGGNDALKITQAEWDRALNINSRGLFFMTQEVINQSMKAEGRGSVVNFASMAGIRGMAIPMCSAWYSASKGAVVAMTMQGAVEWAPLGIRVNAIAPGGVATPAMLERGIPDEIIDPIPMRKLNAPEDIANAVCFLLSDCAATITGQTLVVDGGCSVVGH